MSFFLPYQSIVVLKCIHKILPFFMDVESTATNVFYRKSTENHHYVRPWHLYGKEKYHIKFCLLEKHMKHRYLHIFFITFMDSAHFFPSVF